MFCFMEIFTAQFKMKHNKTWGAEWGEFSLCISLKETHLQDAYSLIFCGYGIDQDILHGY